ncbi:Rz1-like lysis system protein LysC [Erwiniaceae bacterium BAC15a-03b]|uniref:Rz1-like lysis system protein LysC n=1 Tax=Winslowiella arboricola TaxID=2978220 RepID=A0A9J6PM22_9GAMM|nr:Rz1-like lysis system protein LysC [Winslowiella arboricola]MCU5773075.1 Rz1-like lysis system protein LysC [Winslowiella arboricola]MCU5777830.1 Rz1-like lysis system protein LysC [Winslowiella arboricola]
MLLAGCGSARPSPEVRITASGCPKLTPCKLAAANPRSNGDLNRQLDDTEAAWAMCADKVDTAIACENRNSEQAGILTQSPD